jgi:hypothetical protein
MSCPNIALSLKMPPTGVLSEMAVNNTDDASVLEGIEFISQTEPLC